MTELGKRTIFGFLIVATTVVSITLGQIPFIVFFAIILTLSIFELIKLIKIKLKFLIAISAFLIFVLNYLVLKKYLPEGLVLLTSLFVLTILMFNKVISQKPISISDFSKQILCFAYPLLPFILVQDIAFISGGYNNLIIIKILSLIWINDTSAYIVGKTIGKRKILPNVSPKKTIEGFIGALIFTISVGLIFDIYLNDTSPFSWFIISIIISVFGIVGDLFESTLKREFNTKNSSELIPGHGGILDRFDSFIFCIIPIFVYLKFILLI